MDELLSLTEFNFENLIALTGSDPSFIRMLLQEFRSGNTSTLSDLEEKLRQKDYGAARQCVHRLRGGAGNLGAMRLFTQATQLEEQLQKTGAFRKETLEGFRTAFAAVMQQIDSVLPTP